MIGSEETDPNKLHDLKAGLNGYQVYNRDQVEELVALSGPGWLCGDLQIRPG